MVLHLENNCKGINSLKSIPRHVMLLDGFKEKLSEGILPEGVQNLFLGDIKQDLTIDSIPNSVKAVYLLNGFNQKKTCRNGISTNKLTCGIIPEGVKTLEICDIKQQLTIDSIPKYVSEIIIQRKIKQTIIPFQIPKNITLKYAD
ncbi:hypothetical protein DDB_G0271600 [Dictyostelium discoideum AX4]|uniref:FNIP repeat-containing protein n=1 Tax=Dictyostelium discoideum TaxID=44689 RepID=Q86JJ4_DICDI|nr:hypothetical protein DDB_G0271600 [Dictyostelium discoideum AX4]EAL71664.1 hypothetical protein DDB_G0271600 [Dictyostelium discoideum AX4]|eukprot:XP_645545.1 hypothetical protein DDB_G0271600 [Dictyostelium discoideum AX4]